MRIRRRPAPLVSVVVPVFNVESYLPDALDSLLSQTGVSIEPIVVDDGSTDSSGAIVDEYAARDPRLRVLHVPNGGLGSARNRGIALATGSYLGFLDSDDVLPTGALATLVSSLERTGSDFATGSIVRWESSELVQPPWMRRLHNPSRWGLTAREHPEILGDVFAWNKLFRRSFWTSASLSWPEGVRYEDQPTTTAAYLSGRFDVLPEIVYHWRIRTDGSSITQQRASLSDLSDRWATKRMTLASVLEYDDPHTTSVFLDRVLAGDLHRYFLEIPGCSAQWWALLVSGVQEFWGSRSLVDSGLPPVHRLLGYLVANDRRTDAEAVATWVNGLDGPAPRADGRIVVPPEVLDLGTVDPAAVALRRFEL